MTCYFTSFSTVFQSYQDDGWVIMKGCVQWQPVNILKRFPPSLGMEPRNTQAMRDTLLNNTSSSATLPRKFLSSCQSVEK